MLDSDLALIYNVETRILNQAVSQNVISSSKHGGRRKLPFAFTEQGVSMLSSVLNSKQAVQANVQIIRTFVSLRNLASTYRALEKRILEVEEKSDKNYRLLLSAMLQLKEQIEPSLKKERKKIGLK